MHDRVSPLQALADKLRQLGPPSLTTLIARLSQGEDYEEFVRLIREFLPEREAEIRQETAPASQMAKFASYFQDRYFPLDHFLQSGDAEAYADLVNGIPVVVQSVGSEDYEDIASNWRDGYQLLTYLPENPWSDERPVSLAEACLDIVPKELLERVPEPLSIQEMHDIFDNTPYKAAAVWADIINLATNNVFLDTDWDYLSYSNRPEWVRDEVEGLTREWQQGERLWGEVVELVKLIETDPKKHFAKITEYIIEAKGGEIIEPVEPDPRQLRLPLVFAGES